MKDKIKVETRTVTKPSIVTEEIIYITSDNTEHRYKWDAEKHQNWLDAKFIVDNMCGSDDWWLVRSKEEAVALLLIAGELSSYLIRDIYTLPVWIKFYETINEDGERVWQADKLWPSTIKYMMDCTK